MALIASHCHVRSRQRKAALLVHRQRVIDCLERRPGVALLATIPPRSGRKLPPVRVFMAIRAQGKTDLEPRLRSRRRVALFAPHALMRTHQREASVRMLCGGKCRGPPPGHDVARFAAAVVGACGKLSSVRIGPVAVHAGGMRYGRFEIAARVARGARHV